MSRRKDNKGRVLRTGESQRKDLIYQYRYTDALGNRKCIYASDLKTLREKEDELQRSLEDGLDYAGGEITAAQKRKAYEKIKDKTADIVIGTNALIQEKVEYCNLGLVITDEQHRFGVNQRGNLAKKGAHPHVCVMSATPIPRTLAIILYGDLDISIINVMPEGRLPIKNAVVGDEYRPNAYRFIMNEAGTDGEIKARAHQQDDEDIIREIAVDFLYDAEQCCFHLFHS